MTEDEALKLALEALEDLGMKHYESTGEVLYKETFAAIKEALAQPEQEPVGYWMEEFNDGVATLYEVPQESLFGRTYRNIPVYTTPPQRTWVGLTDEEIEVIEALKAPPVHPDFIDCDDWMDFARAIEYKLKEKNELR